VDGSMSDDNLGQLRERFGHFWQQLAADPDESLGSASYVEQIRQRAENLHRHLNESTESGIDPVDSQMEEIRQRLDRLQQGLKQSP
jgi:hypothetical protein